MPVSCSCWYCGSTHADSFIPFEAESRLVHYMLSDFDFEDKSYHIADTATRNGDKPVCTLNVFVATATFVSYVKTRNLSRSES